MAEPLDHQIVAEVVRLLRDIRRANGYRTDAGQHVLTEESQGDIPADAIVLEVLDDDEEADFQNCKRRRAALQLLVAVNFPMAEVDQAIRFNARRVLADIRRALGDPDRHQFPVGVSSLEIGGRSMFVREAGSRYFRPELRARVIFHEQHHRSTP